MFLLPSRKRRAGKILLMRVPMVCLCLVLILIQSSSLPLSGAKAVVGLSAFKCGGPGSFACTFTLNNSSLAGNAGCSGSLAHFPADFIDGVEYEGVVHMVDPAASLDQSRARWTSVPACHNTWINGQLLNQLLITNPGQTCTFSLAVTAVTNLFTWNKPKQGRYKLSTDPADTAIASPASPGVNPASFTWTITANGTGCKISNKGVISGCTNSGSITVKANGSTCMEEVMDVEDCNDGCKGGMVCSTSPGTAAIGMGSVDARFNLGWALQGDTAGFLHIREEQPFRAAPARLQNNFIRSGVEELLSGADIRQMHAANCLVDVVTSNSYSFQLRFYRPQDVTGRSSSTYLYSFTNNPGPFSVFTIENPSNDTNKVRITQTRDGGTNVFDYAYITNGWQLTSGNGLRTEAQTYGWSETNTLKTVTNQIKNAGGSVVYQQVRKLRYSSVGERLLEEVTGSGSTALTNSFTYTTNGLIEQVVRGDGSWEYYRYDTNLRPVNVYSGLFTAGVTTNLSQCKMLEHNYTTNVISGAGDAGYLDSYTPRRTIEYVLGNEVRRKYFVALPGERREYVCTVPGVSWNFGSNLVTVTKLFTSGFYKGNTKSVLRPDGTADIFQYSPIVFARTNFIRTNIVYSGHPDASGTNIDAGTRTLTAIDSGGRVLSRTVLDVPSELLLDRQTFAYDDYMRLTATTNLDGTTLASSYDCCGVDSTTSRDGTETTYTHDALKRVLTTTRNGITLSNAYDAADNILGVVRLGTNGNVLTLSSATFDDAGRQMSSTDPLNNITSYTNYLNGSGQNVRQTTYPNNSTRVEVYNRDGSPASITGSAVHGVRNDYGVESDGGVQRLYSKEIKLDAAGADTAEWTKTYTDSAGRAYKVSYPDGAFAHTSYNTNGQAVKQVNPDGVTTLFQYNTDGELEYTAIAASTNATSIDFTGTDRITRTVTVVTNNGVADVRRISTYVWGTTNIDAATLVSVNETSTDGLRSWSARFGLTNQARSAFAGSGNRYLTNTAPDGTLTIEVFQKGQLLSVTHKDSAGNQLGLTTFGYDENGRKKFITDARTGSTTNTFDNADRVTAVSTPTPGTGASAQVTTMTYNNMGWVTTNGLPDGGVVTTVYHLTGEAATNSGARTYPVAYTYDYGGRLKSMTTWTNFASASGAAVTTWNYDGQRGWLTNKAYADGKGPGYTYTPAGRLKTRTWARGITTTYGYNTFGDASTVDYSDSTADTTNSFDRRGRVVQTLGASTLAYAFNDAGQLLSETRDGLTVTNAYDSLLRRTNVQMQVSGVAQFNHGYTYDSASRLASVTAGTNSVTYAYLTNSALVSSLTFKNSGTTRMTTSKTYDNLNRLLNVSSAPSADSAVSFGYAYNAANQRTSVTNADNARWLYGYDNLGQVTTGKKYWSDGTVVAGQQFEYGFDDIGNREFSASGGDQWGTNLRYENYTANNLNQYIQRTVPGTVNVIGSATNAATVTVNNQPTYRKGDYFRAELTVDNSATSLWQGITNVAVLSQGTNADIVTGTTGKVFVAECLEAFAHDLDGNLTSDSLWTNIWNGENRLISTESASGVPSGGKAKETWSHLPDGRWIERVISTWNGSAYVPQTTNRFVWDGQVLLAIVDHTNGLVMSFARGLDLSGSMQGAGGVGGLLAVDVATNGVHFSAFDGNGNMSALVSATNGSVTANYEYSPFGETLRANGVVAKASPIRFNTQFADDVTGRRKYLHRDLTDTGRWLSRDPIEELGGVNVYGFVANNPISRIDRLGLEIYEIVIMTYIETATIWTPPLGAVFEGDGHGAGGGSFRTIYRLKIETCGPDKGLVPGSIYKDTGITRQLDPVTGAVLKQGKASGSTLKSTVKTGTDIVTVNLYGNETNPLHNPLPFVSAPGITYDITLTFNTKTGKGTLAGGHDGFPSYDLFVGGKMLWTYSHITNGTTPMRLFPRLDIQFRPPRTFDIEKCCE